MFQMIINQVWQTIMSEDKGKTKPWGRGVCNLRQETAFFDTVLEFCFLPCIYLLSLLSFLFESSLFILLSLLALLLPRMLRASRTLRGVAATEEEFGAATLLEPEKEMIDRHYLLKTINS